ncbi:MAG: LysR family transcriptional regulator [Bacteroidia bacterium]|nr:LysR family transcriptional regulator [Bacteroidia bacterium]NND11964.1 LysR family transcriptional regulator [Flavobacteriaceae bacterium]
MEVQIRSRIWIEIEGIKWMGKGHVQLLTAIEKTGSLSGASRLTGISYRKTWRLINQINKLAKHEVVHLQKGGSGGGGATVTPYGRKLLGFFNDLMGKSEALLCQQLKKYKDLWK